MVKSSQKHKYHEVMQGFEEMLDSYLNGLRGQEHGLGIEPANEELVWQELLPMTVEEVANSCLTNGVDASGDIIMDDDESMVMEIDETAGQSRSGLGQASLEAAMLQSLWDNWYPIEKLEMRRFNVLYVPDPSHAVGSTQEVESNLAWAT
ncbi:hypothetical protein EDD16DRAFT_1517206 [Pisolithus croceorrhizus]|nr:hypothetical protein EDD16DRAFT_1517206 [Pisolithus croceorrhizus]